MNAMENNYGNSVENQNDYVSSDNFHYLSFCNLKITKWIYFPVIGQILYFLLYKNFCEVNLIDRRRAFYNRGKFASLLGMTQFSLIIVFAILVIILNVLPNFSYLDVSEKVIYATIPLYVAFAISPFLSLIAKLSLKRLFKVKKINNIAPDFVYKNVNISNDTNYFLNLLKNPNQKVNSFFLSDNFASINLNPITTNYEGTKIQRLENYARWQNGTINIAWFFAPLGFLIMWVAKYFDYFLFGNILLQKAKNEEKNQLSRKINLIIFTNYMLSIIIWAAFILFAVSPLTSFSYFYLTSSYFDHLITTLLHFVYCFIYLILFALSSLARAQWTKRLIVKMCYKEYSK